MGKRPQARIVAISGTARLVATSIVYYMVNNAAMASVEPAMEMQPYFSYSAADAQPLGSLNSEEIITVPGIDPYFPENQAEQDNPPPETAQSRPWGGMLFPIDDYDGQELGRKIGDWVVAQIKNR